MPLRLGIAVGTRPAGVPALPFAVLEQTAGEALMHRTNVVELTPSKTQRRILKEMCLLSSCVYNMANYEARQAFFKGESSPSTFDLQQRLQMREDYRMLGRSYALPRLHIYGDTTKARFALIRSKPQGRVGLPKYLKNRTTNTTLPSYLVMDGCQYSLGARKAKLPLSPALRKKYGLTQFTIPYNGVLRWKGTQQRGQIRMKHKKFYLYQSVELPDPTPITSSVSAGIDLGIKNLVTVVTSTGEERIIGSTRFLRQWEHYGRLIAAEQAKLAARNRRSSNTLKRLYAKRDAYQNHLCNNVIAKTFRLLRRHSVSTIYLGDVSGIREGHDRGATLNRMLHNYWAYDKTLRRKIVNHAEEGGYTVMLQQEAYTSQECPVCGERNTPHDRIYVCGFCSYVNHRDVVGATNILVNGMRDQQRQSAHREEILPVSEVLA